MANSARSFLPSLLVVLLAACVPTDGNDPLISASTSAIAVTGTHDENSPLEDITLPISIYIVDDEAGLLSSGRNSQQLSEIYEKVNEIWSPAGIIIDVQSIQRITLPSPVLEGILGGDFRSFFDEL